MFPTIRILLRSDRKSLKIFRSLCPTDTFTHYEHSVTKTSIIYWNIDNIDMKPMNFYELLFRSSATCFICILYCYFCLNDLNGVRTRKYREIVRFICEYAVVVWPALLPRQGSIERVQREFPSYVAYALKSSRRRSTTTGHNILVVFSSIPPTSFRRTDAHSRFIYVTFSFRLKCLLVALEPPNPFECIPCSFVTILVHCTQHSKCRSSETTLSTLLLVRFIIIYVVRLLSCCFNSTWNVLLFLFLPLLCFSRIKFIVLRVQFVTAHRCIRSNK